MLGQPVYFLTPDVVGVHMTGALGEGVTATDLVLHCTEMLRKAKVVGKFVEYFGEGAASLSLTDRATIANMAPEYGATMGFFGVDEETCNYLKATGRPESHVDAFRNYFKAQGLFGVPHGGEIEYSQVLELDLSTVAPNVAGPKRPQDRIELPSLKDKFLDLLQRPASDNGYGKSPEDLKQRFKTSIGVRGVFPKPVSGGGDQTPETAPAAKSNGLSMANTSTQTEVEMMNNRPTPDLLEVAPPEAFPKATAELGHGDVLIAAITSCTNTSNPSVMLAAGLLAKKAVERGLRVNRVVKASLAPGSRVVSEYLNRTGLQPYLDQLGFGLVGYGCTTCIGNSGPLAAPIEDAINKYDLIAAAVLSGNRNFEARVHQSIKANFLMSPPLVVAFALAGRVDIDLSREPLGRGKDGRDVFLKDIWPTLKEIRDQMQAALKPEVFRKLYRAFAEQNPKWNEIPASTGNVYQWDPQSTYIQEPPFFA